MSQLKEERRQRGALGDDASAPWELEWAAVEAAEREELRVGRSAGSAPAVAGLAALVILAAALPTLYGTSVIMNLGSTGQVAVAVVAAVFAIAVVPATLLVVPSPRLVVLVAALSSAGAAAIHF